jgi:hypothetical protein
MQTGEQASQSTQRSGPILLLEIALVALISWIYLHRLQFQSPYLLEPDGYYHIKAAWLYRTHGIPQNFPWASFSTWKDHFFDKDFGFHVLLMPFTYGDLMLGGKLAAVTFGAALLTSFYAVLRLRDVRWPWLWTVLLISGGGLFIWRINVDRPQILSITLSLWAVYFLLRGSWLRLGLLSVVYALSYTAPHVVVVYALLGGAASFVLRQRWDLRLVVAPLMGILVGSLLHPHFPENFAAWRIQLGGVLSSAWGAGPTLPLGGEVFPTNTRRFLIDLIAIIASGVLAVLALPRLGDRFQRNHLTLLFIALGYFAIACFSQRFVEYLAPFSLLCSAEIISDAWPALHAETRRAGTFALPPSRSLQIALAIAGSALVVFFVALSHIANLKKYRGIHESAYRAPAEWLSQHTKLDEQVFTCDWDDAPELLFYNHHNRYLVILDPYYMYAWNKDIYDTWDSMRMGRSSDPVKMIRDTFGARFGYCTSDFADLRLQLSSDPRARIVSSTQNGYVFELLDGVPEPPKHRFQVSAPHDYDPDTDVTAQLLDRTHGIQWTDQHIEVGPLALTDLPSSPAGTKGACIDLRTELTLSEKPTLLQVRGSGNVAVWVDGQLAYQRVGNAPMRPINTVFAAAARRERATSPAPKDRAEIVARLCQAISPGTKWRFSLEVENR